jgi:hypothetical protein
MAASEHTTEDVVRAILDTGTLDAAWDAIEAGITEYEQASDGTVAELLPPEAAPLGFALPGRARAEELARKVLCSQRDKLRPALEAAIAAGLPAVAPAIAAALAFPPAAAGIVAAFAAIIVTRGLDAFCEGQATDA